MKNPTNKNLNKKKPNKQKEALIWGAAKLFRRHGYAGTGLNNILAASGAPRGSLYYYFPGGKEELGAAAIEAAGRMVTKTLTNLAEQSGSPADFIRAYTTMLKGWLESSDFQDGCPITTTLLETTPASEKISAVGRAVFNDWRKIIEGMLVRHNWPRDRAKTTSAFIIAGFEGALLLARVESNTQPINDTAEGLCALVETVQKDLK